MVSLSNLSVYQCSLYYFDQQWYRDTDREGERERSEELIDDV